MKTSLYAVSAAIVCLSLNLSSAEAWFGWLVVAPGPEAGPTESQADEPLMEPVPVTDLVGITVKAVPIGLPRPDSYLLADTLQASPNSANVIYLHRFGPDMDGDGVALNSRNLITLDGHGFTAPTLSPDGKRVAMVYPAGEWYLWFDRKNHGGFDPASPVSFSSDSQRMVYLARKGTQRFVVDGEHPHPPADTVQWDARVITPDSSVLAYPARIDGQWRMVINGDPGPAWDRIVTAPVSAKKGPSVFYVAARQGRFSVVDRHTPGPAFTLIEQPPVASADGSTFAYWAQGEDQLWNVYRNHKPVPGFTADRPGELLISDDGKTLAAILKRGDSWLIVRNGKPGPGYTAIGANSLTLSPDGLRLAYAVHTQTGWAVVLDEQEQPAHTQLAADSLRFSPDGKRFIYAALDLGRWSVIESTSSPSPVMAQRALAGVVPSLQLDFNQINIQSCMFSPDNNRFAYIAFNAGRPVVVLDGQPLGEYDDASQITFSPDNSHLVYIAQENGESRLYVDGEPTAETFDHLIPGAGVYFTDDTTGRVLVTRRSGESGTTTIWRIDFDLNAPLPAEDNTGTPDTPDNTEPDKPAQPDPSFVDVPTN